MSSFMGIINGLRFFCGIDIDNRIIKIYVFDLDVDQTVLPNPG